MFDFPLFLNMQDKPVVVIGGGETALRKINKLASAGANIVVVAPSIHEELQELYHSGTIHWVKDVCRADYLSTAFLIVSASGSPEARDIIRGNVQPRQLINGADDPSLGNVAFPASFEEQGFHVAVSTEGHSPSAAKRVKQKLQQWFQGEKNYK